MSDIAITIMLPAELVEQARAAGISIEDAHRFGQFIAEQIQQKKALEIIEAMIERWKNAEPPPTLSQRRAELDALPQYVRAELDRQGQRIAAALATAPPAMSEEEIATEIRSYRAEKARQG